MSQLLAPYLTTSTDKQ